jgi:pimeloyl-ACP methyl ester carboxylesterase
MKSQGMTFVLVHGAWRGGWCYSRVAELLRSNGHRVFVPTLTGLGERSHLAKSQFIDCSTHIQDIVNVIEWEDLHDVVLCGHSYGGMVITAVADARPARIAGLVYLDAIIAESGKSLLDLNQSKEVVAGVLQAAADTGGYLTPALPAALFGTNAADLDRVERLCTPHPLACFCERLTLQGHWRRIPNKTYVRATGWQGYEQLGFVSYQSIAGDDTWRKIDIPCGHEVMLDAPDALAEVLLGAA